MRTQPPSDGLVAAHSPTPLAGVVRSRRRFLMTLGAGGAGAVTLAAVASPVAAAAPGGDQNTTDSGYRETEHVRDYYRTARL